MLHRHLDLVVPPPVPLAFLRDVGGYLSSLTLYRSVGPDEWVRWFAHTLERSAISAAATLAAVIELAAEWPARLDGIRSDAAAHRLVSHLVTHPSLDVATAAGLLDVSPPAARAALEALAATGILRRADLPGTGGPGRPRRWWVAFELLDLLTR
jgi:hypothetical protein